MSDERLELRITRLQLDLTYCLHLHLDHNIINSDDTKRGQRHHKVTLKHRLMASPLPTHLNLKHPLDNFAINCPRLPATNSLLNPSILLFSHYCPQSISCCERRHRKCSSMQQPSREYINFLNRLAAVSCGDFNNNNNSNNS